MFIAAMSTIAKLWKELRCPSTDEWIKKIWSIYTMKYYSSIRKDEYPTFASTWIRLEEIMLSEISQAEKVHYHMVSLVEHKDNMEDIRRRKGKVKAGNRRGRMNYEELRTLEKQTEGFGVGEFGE